MSSFSQNDPSIEFTKQRERQIRPGKRLQAKHQKVKRDEIFQKQPDWVKESEWEETVRQNIHSVQRSLKFRSRRRGSNFSLKVERDQTFFPKEN